MIAAPDLNLPGPINAAALAVVISNLIVVLICSLPEPVGPTNANYKWVPVPSGPDGPAILRPISVPINGMLPPRAYPILGYMALLTVKSATSPTRPGAIPNFDTTGLLGGSSSSSLTTSTLTIGSGSGSGSGFACCTTFNAGAAPNPLLGNLTCLPSTNAI